MPKPIKFNYEKRLPFRDASLFIIVCEGSNREIDYFRFFDGLSSRIKVVPATSSVGSAPRLLIEVAIEKEIEWDTNADSDEVWFVIDTDKWREQLHEIRQECTQRPNWQVVQSNPCFEVWLYFHAKAELPVLAQINKCSDWKAYLPTVIQGGFNSDCHPIAIETAISNARAVCQETGYLPEPGSTQVWKLGERLLPLIQKDLEELKSRFPSPSLIME